MHGSLLPQFRGRAPTNWAVLMGATQTGATLHEMVAKPDAGAIVDQSAVPILPDDTAREVFDKVTVVAEQVLWRSLPALLAGNAPRLPNDLSQGSYFGGRKPEDGRIDWSQPLRQVYNLVRAVAPPYPGAFTELAGQRLVVAQARPRQADAAAPARAPGLQVEAGRIIGVCGDGGVLDIHQLLRGATAVDAAGLSSLLKAL
jgi:methionyl-tRNA formyltransferase